MKTIALMNVWMGKLPDSFELWIESAKANNTIDFYIFTDQEYTTEAKNIHVINYSFEEIKELFESKLGMRIKLNRPYKLCDYKPIMGLAFEQYIKDYDFWGYCDFDLIWGDIRHFMTDELLEQYDKFFETGWCSIYRNNDEMKYLFKRTDDKNCTVYSYKKAFKNNYACYLDEYMGISIIDWKYNLKVLRDQKTEAFGQDFSWNHLNFVSYISKESFVFNWKDGHLYKYLTNEYSCVDEYAAPKEIMAAHIQKRKMEVNIDKTNINDYWIVPNQFTYEKPVKNLYNKQAIEDFYFNSKEQDKKRSISNLKNNGIIDYIPHYFRRKKIVNFIRTEKGFF